VRILLVTSEYGSYVCGGLGSHVNQLVEYLVSMGIQLTVGLANHECVAVIAYDGLQERCLSLKQPSVLNGDWHDDQMAANQLLANEIMRLYPELPFDLIHTHDWISFPVGRQLVHHGRQPHISTVHVFQAMLERTGYIPDQRACAIEAAMCAESDHVITVSNYMHEQVVVQPGVRPHAVTRIYNWLDPDQFNRESAEAVQHLRQQLAPAGEQIVLFVGRLSIQKGVEFLLESAEYVLAERPHTRWVVDV
jgi:glycosyltransferase involved in cell wall biosynthesis